MPRILYVSATSLKASNTLGPLLIVQFQISITRDVRVIWIWLVRVFPRLQKSINQGPGYNYQEFQYQQYQLVCMSSKSYCTSSGQL